MCGIFVVAERHGSVDRARFNAAVDAIAHRGPDGVGHAFITLDPRHGGGNLAIGHRRLSILDPSERASQPFRRSGSTLVYNGAIYNFRALRHGLDGPFSTDGDTEVLFETMRQHGLDGLGSAIGMWAFCYLDEAGGRLIAARDHYGKKPLFYHASESTICFASQIGAIDAYLKRRPVIAQGRVDTFLAYGWTMPGSGTTTPIEGIRQVEPGGHVAFDLASWRISTGTHAAPDDPATAAAGDPRDLGQLARAAVLDRLVSDRQVGLLLSGGVDSSLILSILASEGLQDRVHCFTGDAGKSEDAAYARQAAEAFGIKLDVIALDYAGGSIDRFLSICHHQEKPFPFIGNVLGLPQLYERIAERNVPVVLDGTGADELFGGYWERYYRFAVAEAWRADDQAWLDAAFAANAECPAKSAIGRSTIAALEAGTWPPASTVGAAPAAGIAPLLARYCAADVAQAAPADQLVDMKGPLRSALHADTTVGLLPEWLWQNDRSAMRAGIENRSPFLDTRLSPFMASGYRAKFRGPWNKHELRQLFDRFRPASTQWRREKQGFRWVFARFLRANRTSVLELIAASSLVRARVNAGSLIDAIARDEELLFSDLTQRCLCLAGLEATTGLQLR